MRWRLAWVRQRVQGQPRLYSKMFCFFFKIKEREEEGRRGGRGRGRKKELNSSTQVPHLFLFRSHLCPAQRCIVHICSQAHMAAAFGGQTLQVE